MSLGPDSAPQLYLALLLYNFTDEATVAVLDRFHVRKTYRNLVLEVRALKRKGDGLKQNSARPSDVVAVLDESSEAARLVLRVASDDWLVRQRLDSYQRRWRHIQPELTGDDLRAMGLPPGRIYRQVLERLRTGRLDGSLHTREDEEATVRAVVEAAKS